MTPVLRKVRASKMAGEVEFSGSSSDEESDAAAAGATSGADPFLMGDEEREEWRRKIRQVIDASPDVEEEADPEERRRKMQKLLAEYPLVVEEDDPDWPEDADGRGFNFDQFFNKITIKNVKKDDDDDDDDYDSDKEIVWQDDDYIKPIRDITAQEWEDMVFKDFNPLVILVHNRYKRFDLLSLLSFLHSGDLSPYLAEPVSGIFHGDPGLGKTSGPAASWRERSTCSGRVDSLHPGYMFPAGIISAASSDPRLSLISMAVRSYLQCAAVDAVVEQDLASALRVSIFPEIIFTKAGKILHRDRGTSSPPAPYISDLRSLHTLGILTVAAVAASRAVVRTADEWSKMMAFFYYKASRPPWLDKSAGQSQEKIPSLPSE